MYKLYSATIELTRQCNAKCKHCIIDASVKKENELSIERILTLIEELHDEGCENITFTGGEALIRKELPLFLQKTISLNIQPVLMTNGLLLNDSTIHMLKKFDVTLGISLDGATARSHDELRGVPGLFNHVCEMIPKLKKAGIYVAIPTTVMQSNYNELEKIKDLLIKLKVDSWQLQVVKPCSRLNPTEILTEHQYYELAKKIVKYRKKYHKKLEILEADCIGYNSKLNKDLYINNWRGCECGIYSVSIESDGNVKGCPNMNDSEGNISETNFKSIWQNHSSFSYNRKPNINNLKGFCNECEHKYICRGGCPTNAYTKNNNPYCLYKIETIGFDE